MQIASVEAIPVEIDIKQRGDGLGIGPYVGGHKTNEASDRLLVRLETEDGTIGWGETQPYPSKRAAVDVIENEIAPQVVGTSVWEIESLNNVLEFEYLEVTALVSGVEIAMLDALGKSLGAPLHQLLGGKLNDSVPVSFCIGILDPEESREYAAFAREKGFSVLKTKGGLDIDQDINRLTAMADELNGELDLRLDANQSLGFEDAVRVGARLEDAGVYLQYIEQPMRIDTPGSYARLRNRLQTPVAINEDAYVPRNLFQLASADAIDVAVVDLIPAGGVMATKQLAGVAGEAGISLTHHSAFDLGVKTAAVLHLDAATPEFNLAADRVNYTLEDDVLAERIPVEEGEMPVPTEPGLGVTVDEAKVEEYRVPL
jgi:L-alanine-DL-glutamate epimerase-like enolase superfamily enzyme